MNGNEKRDRERERQNERDGKRNFFIYFCSFNETIYLIERIFFNDNIYYIFFFYNSYLFFYILLLNAVSTLMHLLLWL